MQDGRIAIGRRIKRLRELRGLSRQQIADELKVDLTAAAAWEAGKYLPREGRRVRLADMLSIDVGTLFAEEQEPGPSTGAALVDPLAEMPGLLRELVNNTHRRLRIFRLASPHPTQPFVQEEFRRLADARIVDGTITVDTVEAFYSLARLKEALSLMLRYRDRGHRLRAVAAGASQVMPSLSGFLFDEQEFLLGGYWPEAMPNGHHGLRLSGEPYRTFLDQYWEEIWSRARPLNPDGAADLGAVRDEALKLGLAAKDWERFLGEAEDLTLEDGLPPRV